MPIPTRIFTFMAFAFCVVAAFRSGQDQVDALIYATMCIGMAVLSWVLCRPT